MQVCKEKKKITFLTGTRADFGKLKPLISRIAEDADRYSYEIIATGMHLLKKYGNTIGEIRKAGFDNIVPMFNQEGLATDRMDTVLANTISPLSHYFSESRPDLFIVHGDRVESLAGAISGALNNIRVAHIEGGEVSGTIDESIRHAISKIAPLHFVSNSMARVRLLQMGEDESSIFEIGSPEVDVMLGSELPDIELVKAHYRIGFEEFAIAIYHPVTTEADSIQVRAKNFVDAMLEVSENFIVIQPNNDLGSHVIREELDRLRALERIKIFPSLRFEYYLALLKNCRFLIGNSSSGVREAPVFGVPSINLGSRQSGRNVSAGIIDVAEKTIDIVYAINAIPKKISRESRFGKGNAAEAFGSVLENSEFWKIPLQKQFHERVTL